MYAPVESSEMRNSNTGNVTTDAQGARGAHREFDVLNTDSRE
jgi:hypothetical protein